MWSVVYTNFLFRSPLVSVPKFFLPQSYNLASSFLFPASSGLHFHSRLAFPNQIHTQDSPICQTTSTAHPFNSSLSLFPSLSAVHTHFCWPVKLTPPLRPSQLALVPLPLLSHKRQPYCLTLELTSFLVPHLTSAASTLPAPETHLRP